jgi:hypothetical protein
MHALILQIQMLLAAVGAVAPLAPEPIRPKLVAVFKLIGEALSAVDAGADALEKLAPRLSRIRRDVEALAESGQPVSADALDAAMARVAAASAAFRRAARAGG